MACGVEHVGDLDEVVVDAPGGDGAAGRAGEQALDRIVLPEDDEFILFLGVADDFIPDALVVDASRVAGLHVVGVGERAGTAPRGAQTVRLLGGRLLMQNGPPDNSGGPS